MKRIKIFLILFLVSFFVSAQNDGEFKAVDQIETVKTAISQVSGSTQTIQSDFSQEKHLTMLEEVLISKGRFLFRKENDVRWEYNYPIDYTIVIFNEKFRIKDGEKISEFDIASNKLFEEINKMIITAIRGDFIDNPNFKSSFFENDKRYKVELIPLNQQVADMLSSIEIQFNKESLDVEAVKFFEQGEDFTLIVFNNRQVNTEIIDEHFEF